MGEKTPGSLRRSARKPLQRVLARRGAPLPKAHFLHVSKAGGGSVKVALGLGPSGLYQVVTHDHTVSLADIPVGEGVFFFVRDPIARFVSGFNWRLQQTPTKPPSDRKEAQLAAFATFPTADSLGVALADQLSPLHDDAINAMNSIGHVRSHYTDWLVSPDYLLSRTDDLLFIGTQEELKDDFEILKGILRLPTEAQLPPPDHPRSHRNSARFDTSLSPGARDAIRNWYAEDYRLLETCQRLRARWVPTSAPMVDPPSSEGRG